MEMKHQTVQAGGLGGRVVTYLTFMPDCRRSGVQIPVGKKKITKQPFNLNAQCYTEHSD